MGLDSVALIVDIEEAFNIQIPDTECEQIYTVNDLVDAVEKRVSLLEMESKLFQCYLQKIKTLLVNCNNTQVDINGATKLSMAIGTNSIKACWELLEDSLKLKLPRLTSIDLNKNKEEYFKILGVKIFKRDTPLLEGTIEDLVNWVIAINYTSLLTLDTIANRYELECMIIGIIHESVGVPINEIELNHSITADLGID